MGKVIDISGVHQKKKLDQQKAYFFKTYSSSKLLNYDLTRIQVTFKEANLVKR